jgi:hypothetical protein
LSESSNSWDYVFDGSLMWTARAAERRAIVAQASCL